MTRLPAADRLSEPRVGLLSSPLGALVRAVARVRASVHVKLLAGFLFITLLFIAMSAVSLQTLAATSRTMNRPHQAPRHADWPRQIEQALAMRMPFTPMALLA